MHNFLFICNRLILFMPDNYIVKNSFSFLDLLIAWFPFKEAFLCLPHSWPRFLSRCPWGYEQNAAWKSIWKRSIMKRMLTNVWICKKRIFLTFAFTQMNERLHTFYTNEWKITHLLHKWTKDYTLLSYHIAVCTASIV